MVCGSIRGASAEGRLFNNDWEGRRKNDLTQTHTDTAVVGQRWGVMVSGEQGDIIMPVASRLLRICELPRWPRRGALRRRR